MLRKLFFLFVFLILIANFCWNKQPLYKYFFTGKISTKTITNKIKQQTQTTVNKTKHFIKHSSKSIKKKINKVEDVSKKDKEDLNLIIKKHVKK